MPHLIDLDGVADRLFVLMHLCYGSRQFCEKAGVHRLGTDEAEYEWWEYFGLLKSNVSSTVIDASIKLRMVQDFVTADEHEIDLDRLDVDARNGDAIGVFREGTGKLTLRESCNKVVHATEARLQWEEVTSGSSPFEYWSGIYSLWGSKGKAPWQVDLFIEQWCRAMIRFNRSIQELVDWHRVTKWDE